MGKPRSWCSSTEIVGPWAFDYLAAYQEAGKPRGPRPLSATVGRSSNIPLVWRPPSPGVFKVNTDAAVCVNKPVSGLSMIIRDHIGDVKASTVWRLPNAPDVEWAEALAVRNALFQCISFNFLTIQLDSDCLSLIQKINSPFVLASTLGSIIDDIKHLSNSFDFIVFAYCPRIVNVAADLLAKSGLCIPENKIWLPGYPDCIRHVIMADASNQ